MNAYHIPIKDSIVSSWEKVQGSKASIWAAMGIIVLFAIGMGLLAKVSTFFSVPFLTEFVRFIGQIIISLMQIALLYFGIERAKGLPLDYKYIYRIFDISLATKLIINYLLQIIILAIPLVLMAVGASLLNKLHSFNINLKMTLLVVWFALGIIVLIYLAVRLRFSAAFILDKNLHAWDAIKASYSITKHNVLRIIAIYIILLAIMLVSLIPLGIGLIWTLPFALIVYGSLYQQLSLNQIHEAG